MKFIIILVHQLSLSDASVNDQLRARVQADTGGRIGVERWYSSMAVQLTEQIDDSYNLAVGRGHPASDFVTGPLYGARFPGWRVCPRFNGLGKFLT